MGAVLYTFRHKRPSCALLQATPAETLKSLLSYGKCAKSHVFPMKNVRNPTFFIGIMFFKLRSLRTSFCSKNRICL